MATENYARCYTRHQLGRCHITTGTHAGLRQGDKVGRGLNFIATSNTYIILTVKEINQSKATPPPSPRTHAARRQGDKVGRGLTSIVTQKQYAGHRKRYYLQRLQHYRQPRTHLHDVNELSYTKATPPVSPWKHMQERLRDYLSKDLLSCSVTHTNMQDVVKRISQVKAMSTVLP